VESHRNCLASGIRLQRRCILIAYLVERRPRSITQHAMNYGESICTIINRIAACAYSLFTVFASANAVHSCSQSVGNKTFHDLRRNSLYCRLAVGMEMQLQSVTATRIVASSNYCVQSGALKHPLTRRTCYIKALNGTRRRCMQFVFISISGPG